MFIKQALFLGVAMLSTNCSNLLAETNEQPSINQLNTNEQPSVNQPNTNEQPSINQLNTNEIGQTPAQLGQEQYIALVNRARDTVSQLPTGQAIKFPLGTYQPILIGDISTTPQQQGNTFEAVGFVDNAGNSKPFTPSNVLEMFDAHLSSITPSTTLLDIERPDILVADASSTFYLAQQQVPVIDLIVFNQESNRFLLVKNVRLISLIRDSLNAALNGTIAIYDTDIPEPENQITEEEISNNQNNWIPN